MSSRTLTDIRRNLPALRLVAAVVVAAVWAAGVSGCSLFKREQYNLGTDSPEAIPQAPAKGASKSTAGGGGGGGGGASPERVKQRFEHAVSLMQSGNTEQAEVELRDVMLLAPQQAAPVVDLSILYRKQGKLEEAEQILRTSAAQSANAMVLTELGLTQRMRGEFRDAQASYEKAITVDPKYAPAYRDLGVVSDVYLGDAPKALTAFERYQELAGEDKTVSNWIAELRVRTGQKLPPKAADSAKDSAKTDAAAGAAATPPGTTTLAPVTATTDIAAKADPAPKGGAAADAAAPSNSAAADAPAPKARKAAKSRKASSASASSSSAGGASAAGAGPDAQAAPAKRGGPQ